jgi:hypothetical protein
LSSESREGVLATQTFRASCRRLRHFKLIEDNGLDKPIQIVQLGATDAEIINMAALAAFGVGG